MIMKASPYIRMIFDVDLIIVNENEILFPIIAFSILLNQSIINKKQSARFFITAKVG